MKQIILIFSLILITLFNYSCSSDYTSSNTKINERKYKEEICPVCKGTGTVPQTTSQKIGFAIVTFGMTLMTDDEQQCPKCHGKGYVTIPVLNDSIIVK